jgi:hypothetical protein
LCLLALAFTLLPSITTRPSFIAVAGCPRARPSGGARERNRWSLPPRL